MADLRRMTLLAGLLGQVAVAVAGVLPWPLLPVTAAAFVAGAVASGRFGTQGGRTLRGIASAIAVLLFVLTLPYVSADRDSLRGGLGLLLVGIQVVHGATWRVRRDLETGLLVASALLVLGASYAPDVLVGLPLLLGWAAVLAGAVLAAGQRALEGTDAVADGGRRPPVVAVNALAMVLGLAAFLLVPVEPTLEQQNPFAALASGGGGGRGNVAYSSSRLDLRIRGSLSEAPVVEVPADSPQLWRSGVYPFYDGLGWAGAGNHSKEVPGPPWVLSETDAPTRTDEASMRGRSGGTVWTPGEPVLVEGARGRGLYENALGTLRSRGSLRSYRVTSVPQQLDPAVLRSAAGGPDVGRIWLQLPQRLPDRVRALSSRLTAGAATRYDAVTAVEDWLRSNATYQLDSPVPQPGEDAVDRFLFVDRVGFCEQFAAAETVLLRAAGIPARLATGLAYGVPAGEGRRLYREKDLHAWVEVFYPGVGWTSSDPTAGVPLAAGGLVASVRQRLANAVESALRRAETVPGGRRTLAVALLGVAVIVVVLTRRRGARPDVAATALPQLPPGRAGPALAAFLRYDERLGERRRRPAESLAELAARLDAEPAAAVAVVADECYAPVPPADAQRAAELLDAQRD